MNKINEKQLEEILEEMCNRVGADYAKMNFAEKEWYYLYEWTVEESLDFQRWLGKYLIDNKIVRKGKYRDVDRGYYEAGKFVFNYGWRYKI